MSRLLLLLTAIYLLASVCLYAQVSFVKRPIDPVPNKLSGLCVADLDNDGDKDITVCEHRVNKLVVWINLGGTPIVWSRHVVGNGVEGPLGVCSGDIDSDGREDLVVSSYGGTGAISWWPNDGGSPENWERHDIRTGFTDASSCQAVDIDRDGRLDILGTSEGLGEVVWWRNGGGDPIVWTEQVIDGYFPGTQTAVAADIDGDGNLDVVAGSGDASEVAWWQNDGGNPIVWTRNTIGTNFYWAHCVYACDIDGDSRIDVVGAAYTGDQVAWWRNSGGNPIFWAKQTIQSAYDCPLIVHAGDIDNDSHLDVVASSAGTQDDITWWRNSGDSPIVWTANAVDNDYNGGWPVYVSDLDSDGDQDVVAGADSYEGGVALPLTWWENRLIVQLECSSSPNWGWGPLTVDFQASSTHAVTGWSWDFGDGDSAFTQSPTHTYQTPGLYTVSLKIDSPDTTITRVMDTRISVLADSVIALDAEGSQGKEVEVVIEGVNFVPLKRLVLPVEYDGQLGLSLDSFSVAGCRTQVFDTTRLSFYDPANHLAEFTFFSVDSTAVPLVPGRGAILKLYLRIAAGSSPSGTSSIKLVGFTGHSPGFSAPAFEYVPKDVSAVISLSMVCGDANADHSVNISDAVYLIAYIFSGGPPPNPFLAGDSSCDNVVNISDAVYLIAYIFAGGSAPCSSCM